jgi:Pyrimidine operon attenuation protein/uracil phosphoribosyltransferase
VPKRCIVPTPKSIAASEIHAAIDRIAQAILQRHGKNPKLLLLGIANGGIELARRLGSRIPGARTGTLDISFHRDDIERQPIPKEFSPTHIPADVRGATVILVDDVLFSGRTVKAALDELFDHGRPERVELAVLIDRGHRRLPLTANYVGIEVSTFATQKIVVRLDPEKPAHDTIRIESTVA